MDNKSPERVSIGPSSKDLLPGGMSRIGFLAEGQTLEHVLIRDAHALSILEYSPGEVADLLEPLCDMDSPNESTYKAANGKVYHVSTTTYRGWQDCPWRDIKIPSNSSKDIKVRTESGKTITIPGMLPHLIKSHNFFEGGDYRLAPEDVVEMFGVERKPGSIEKARALSI